MKTVKEAIEWAHKACPTDSNVANEYIDTLAAEVRRLQEENHRLATRVEYFEAAGGVSMATTIFIDRQRAEAAEARCEEISGDWRQACENAATAEAERDKYIAYYKNAEAQLHEYAECPFCGESCERGEYTTVDGLKRQLTALEEALFPCQVMWAESCVCSRGTKGCVMTHLSDPPSALQVAEAEINEYSSRVVRLAEEGEQLRRKLAKAKIGRAHV